MIAAYIYRSALADFLRPKRVLVWVIVSFALFAMAILYKKVNEGKPDADMYSILSSVLAFRLLPLASAIFSTAVISAEVEQRTIVYLLTRPVPRAQLILMRTLASMTAVAILSFFCVVLVSLSVYGPSGFLSNPYLWRDAKAVVVGAAAYGGLFVVISLLVNRAMIVCLLYAFAWETSVPNMSGSMYYLSITSYLNSIAERPSDGNTGNILQLLAGSFGTNSIPNNVAWPVMIVLVICCVVLAMAWFTKFEFVPREDGE